VRDRTRKPARKPLSAIRSTSEHRARGAKATKDQHHRAADEIDWDAAVARLKKMLDDMEDA
jgi:hypothetical protein